MKGQDHNDSSVRVINLPPHASFSGWKIDEYKNKWEIIEDLLRRELGIKLRRYNQS